MPINLLYPAVLIGWFCMMALLEGRGALLTVPTVTLFAVLFVFAARGNVSARIGMDRPMQRGAFYGFLTLLSIMALSIGIEGRGGQVGNGPVGITLVVATLLLTAVLICIDMVQQLRAPLKDIPESWK